MTRYIGDLITEVRRDTENESFSTNNGDSYGISTEDFLRYANFALQRIQAKLISNNVNLFRRAKDISIVANQASYSISDNVYLGESIVDVQYSPTSQEVDYREIREVADSNRYFGTSSQISAYTRRQGLLYVSPVPSVSQGTLRVTYERQIDMLDTRRGVIDAITISGGAITANTISIDHTIHDQARIDGITDKYLCICDKDGNVKAYNIPYTAYNNGSGNFTHPSFTLTSGLVPAIGDYITLGKYTTTHMVDILHPAIERYTQIYMAMKITRRDSNVDSELLSRELGAIEDEIIESYRASSKDEWEINIENSDILLSHRRY